MTNSNQSPPRRADLDALRAGAMFLGIVLHATLAFFPSGWMAADSKQNIGFGVLFSAIHGFRMPLFFVLSGFFSAMLLHKSGSMALVKHRYRRVFLPLLLGMVTFVPLTVGVSMWAMAGSKPPTLPESETTTSNIWLAAKNGDLQQLELYLDEGVTVDARDPVGRGTALQWAAASGQTKAMNALVRRGANLNSVTSDGGTALHAASFLAHVDAVRFLVENGAEINKENKNGNTPLDLCQLDDQTTRYYASLLKLDLDELKLSERKEQIATFLKARGGTPGSKTGLIPTLMHMSFFSHLWFLWFLWWFVLIYAGMSAVLNRFANLRIPEMFIISPAKYLWLIPLTMLPQWFMGENGDTPLFGPDTSTGLLPIPHVFAYYAIFFFYGVLFFDCEKEHSTRDNRWWIPMAIGLLVMLPLGLLQLPGGRGVFDLNLGSDARRAISIVTQACYPWLLTFGFMGLVKQFWHRENARIQYLSDSAYWLYLAHLPLVIALQVVMKDWPIPSLIKFLLNIVFVTVLLLWIYERVVRYSWLGRFLNGPRQRPAS